MPRRGAFPTRFEQHHQSRLLVEDAGDVLHYRIVPAVQTILKPSRSLIHIARGFAGGRRTGSLVTTSFRFECCDWSFRSLPGSICQNLNSLCTCTTLRFDQS
jgi:hypothetical protein